MLDAWNIVWHLSTWGYVDRESNQALMTTNRAIVHSRWHYPLPHTQPITDLQMPDIPNKKGSCEILWILENL